MNDTPAARPETEEVTSTTEFPTASPCLPCSPAQPNPTPATASDAGPHTVRILCIDDDPLFLEQISDILQDAGHRALTARDADAGLSRAAHEHPDLILLDIVMPGMDGIEVCRRLKQDPRSAAIPVVLLTRLNHPELNPKAIDAGALLALQKTSSPDAVLRLIDKALALSRSQGTTDPPRSLTRPIIAEPPA